MVVGWTRVAQEEDRGWLVTVTSRQPIHPILRSPRGSNHRDSDSADSDPVHHGTEPASAETREPDEIPKPVGLAQRAVVDHVGKEHLKPGLPFVGRGKAVYKAQMHVRGADGTTGNDADAALDELAHGQAASYTRSAERPQVRP